MKIDRPTAKKFILVAFLMLSGTTAGQAQEPNASQENANVISGRVVSRDGEPLVKARVSVARVNSSGMPQSVRVDNAGSFRTNSLEPGVYWVSAGVTGYVMDPTRTPSPAGFYHPGDNVTLTMVKGGVITGTVRNSNNEPVVAIAVRAIRVKDQNGKPVLAPGVSRERLTDDRGVYRIYGVTPGTYIVSAGGTSRFNGSPTLSAYQKVPPTFAPGGTREGATEIVLNSNEETIIDITFRDDPGHAVSGSLLNGLKPGEGTSWAISVSLLDVITRLEMGSTYYNATENQPFALYGVPDGDYELTASQGSSSGDQVSSSPKRIRVQGADVTGITLAMMPMGAIDGRLNLEPMTKGGCGKRREWAQLETLIYVRRFEPEKKANAGSKSDPQVEVSYINRSSIRTVFPESNGSFVIKNLRPGNYRIEPREPAPGWYVRTISLGAGPKAVNVARQGISLQSAEHLSGLTLTLKEGAARLRGRISLGEGQSLPPAVRVYLAPAEKEEAENVLRFYEARPEADGSFTVDNLAPGKYWITARPSEENETGATKLIRLDSPFRAKVFSEAEAGKREIGFKPCEQIADYDLPYPISAIPR